MSDPRMPAEVREAVIEILASALVADVEQYPELYGLADAIDQPVAAPTDEPPRDLTRSPGKRPSGSVSPARRRRVKTGAAAASEGR